MSKEVISPSQFGRSATLIEDEQLLSLNEDQLQELSDLYDGFFTKHQLGKIVIGKIIKVENDGVTIDIGYKSDGLVTRYEFTEREMRGFKVGDDIEVILDQLESAEGELVLSYEKAKALKAWDVILKLFEEDKPVDGVITHKVKGGLNVDIGVPAFLPGSQVDVQRVMNFDQFVGQTITANIIKVNKKRGNVIISRRKFLSDIRTEGRKKVLDTLEIGQIIKGIVKNITNYGVFVDIGGVDGLLHITDMTWGRIAHPSEVVKIGDHIDVQVLSFDKDNEKISLGMKQLTKNPWESISEEVKIGSKIKGRISSITDYGLFIEVQKGVEGLVHISEISWTSRITDLNQHYQVGQEIETLVISFDRDNRRMSLSIKQFDKNPWETIGEEFKAGDKIKGTISNITEFGIFVQLKPGIDGLVHVSDLSWTEHIEHPADRYQKGQEIEAIVLSVEGSEKKVSLGIKQLQQDPWELIESQYKVGNIIDGEIQKITNFGIFVRLPNGVEGLVHISDIHGQGQKEGAQRLESMYKVGDKQQFRIAKISKDEHKLALSTRLVEEVKPAAEEKKSASVVESSVEKPSKKEKVVEKQQAAPAEPTPKAKNSLQLELEKFHQKQKKE